MVEKILNNLLPPKLLYSLQSCTVYELRMKLGRKAILTSDKGRVVLDYVATKDDINYVLDRATHQSLYAYTDMISRGYISTTRGVRIGLVGEVVVVNGEVSTIKDINSLIFRVPHDVLGVSDPYVSHIYNNGQPLNTLVTGLPSSGKTTMLRDISRALSNMDIDVLILDEKNEISATVDGVPTLDVGESEVMVSIPRKIGFETVIRNASPDVLITDEIYGKQDIEEVLRAMRTGVCVVASAHSSVKDDFEKSFDIVINLSVDRSGREYSSQRNI